MLLSIVCTAMLKHGYNIVNTILETVITPVIKNKSEDATEKHNYRPIAISTTMSKVMLHKIDSYLYITGNQFGFKQTMVLICVYALRHNHRLLQT